jgi:hypothetical protein
MFTPMFTPIFTPASTVVEMQQPEEIHPGGETPEVTADEDIASTT